MKVAVFGLGYVGTVTAACLAASGHDVWGVDPESDKVRFITQGASPVVEPGLDQLVATSVAEGRLHATTDPAGAVEGAEISLICVGTPSSPHGDTDLSYILRAVKEIGQALAAGPDHAGFHSVVVRSTVPPGTVEEQVVPTLEAETGHPAGQRFAVGMCPEFLREGSGVGDFFDPPFTVIGTVDARVATSVSQLFDFVKRPMRLVGVRTAESLKYACNAYHATKVSFANEFARLSATLGVDAREVMELFCEDDRLNISPMYLRPGFAFGGSCLPKDLRALLYLGRANHVELPLLNGTLASNHVTMRQVVQRVVDSGARKVAMLGLSFKTQTDDLRESPNVELAETLLGKGFDLRIYDPIVKPSRLVGTNRDYVRSKLPHLQRVLVDDVAEVIGGVDLAVVSSDAASVVTALLEDPPPVLIDLCGRLGGPVEALPGYQGVAW